jgi:hypothetical protein
MCLEAVEARRSGPDQIAGTIRDFMSTRPS